jgi:hypothetical protein
MDSEVNGDDRFLVEGRLAAIAPNYPLGNGSVNPYQTDRRLTKAGAPMSIDDIFSA